MMILTMNLVTCASHYSCVAHDLGNWKVNPKKKNKPPPFELASIILKHCFGGMVPNPTSTL
jgi:hypothetical protein